MKSSERRLANNPHPLPRIFFQRQTLVVAKELLGKGLFIRHGNTPLLAEIVEVEAYLGKNDPASHSYRGITKRNWPMFEEGGMCYVYLSYGINFCMNVVTGKTGVGEAVLLRAAIPRSGEELMQERRGTEKPASWLSGPGKLTQALGIDLTHNGRWFDQDDFRLIDLGVRPKPSQIGQSPRIGISSGKDALFRFYIDGSPWLSRRTK